MDARGDGRADARRYGRDGAAVRRSAGRRLLLCGRWHLRPVVAGHGRDVDGDRCRPAGSGRCRRCPTGLRRGADRRPYAGPRRTRPRSVPRCATGIRHPTTLVTMVDGHRVWERRPGDADFGAARIGSGPQDLVTPLVPAAAGTDDLDPVGLAAMRRLIDTYAIVDDLPVALAIPRVQPGLRERPRPRPRADRAAGVRARTGRPADRGLPLGRDRRRLGLS